MGSINDVLDSPIPIVASATTSLKPTKQGDIFHDFEVEEERYSALSSFKPTVIGSLTLLNAEEPPYHINVVPKKMLKEKVANFL